MANVTIYLPAELHARAKRAGAPISNLTQHALRAWLLGYEGGEQVGDAPGQVTLQDALDAL